MGYVHGNNNCSENCGYCKNNPEKLQKLKDEGKHGSYQWGFSSPKTTVQDYQDLMDKGWRRCGE